MRKLFASLLIIGLSSVAIGQEVKIKFGKVDAADFSKTVYSIDSNAQAVYLADIGSTEIVGNTKGWFSLEFKKHARIHILNKSAYDLATVEVGLYTDGTATEKLNNLKAVTYNLENGKVVESKLDKDNIFTEKVSRNLVVKKFTLPNVKEGSIIEFTYTLESDFLRNLQPWSFQGQHPRLWSEYRLSMPQFLEYAFLSQGGQNFFIKQSKDKQVTFNVADASTSGATERYVIPSSVTDYRWAMKDVPKLKPESFTSSVDNYISKIEFQLSAYKHPLTYKSIMTNWTEIAKDLLESEDFGNNLNTNNTWLSDVMKPLLAGATTETEKAKRIYDFVRDNITCTSHYGIYLSQSLKNVLKNKNGRVSEINLLLTAMLRYADIQADPIILSTKENGFTSAIYPLLSRFNYIVSHATVDGKPYYLDATHTKLGFGKLLPECYNGHARMINKAAPSVEMYSDSLMERKVTAIFISNDEKGNWRGSMKQNPGYYESYAIRQKIGEAGQDGFFKEVKKNYGIDVEIKNPEIDSLNKLELPIAMRYDFVPAMEKVDLIYLNPMFGEGYRENPFKSTQRLYPVEMPYTFDETYIASIEVPVGYKVDELPKPMKLMFNDQGEGFFEYLISQSGTTISLRSRIKMQRATFHPDEYEYLREFYNMIVNKQKEQIVFKKLN